MASVKGVNILGGVLAGSGAINANVVNAGQLDPGSDGLTGILTINGNYTQTADGTLAMVIAGDKAGSRYDQLVVSGTATLDGALTVSLGSNFVPDSGASYPILLFHALSGAFALTNIDPTFLDSPLYDPMDVTIVAN